MTEPRTFAQMRPLVLEIVRAANGWIGTDAIQHALSIDGEEEQKCLRDVLRYCRNYSVLESIFGFKRCSWRATGKKLRTEIVPRVANDNPRPGKELRVAVLLLLRSASQPMTTDAVMDAVHCRGITERDRCRSTMRELARLNVIYSVQMDGAIGWRASGKLTRTEIYAARIAANGGKKPKRIRKYAQKAKPVKPLPKYERQPPVSSIWQLATRSQQS